ncbi:AAA family ATPase [Larkinella sp.]|uniref:AAA family ATPase n=1 Tax=Larkinella sp. TaxID=2034517 RepID=UPI003BAC26D6
MNHFRIEELVVNKIGPFAHLKMKFPQKVNQNKAEIHILTGENGTGKSTILQILSRCIPQNDPVLKKKQWTAMVDESNYTIAFSDGYKGNYDFRHLRYIYTKGSSKSREKVFSIGNDIIKNINSPTIKNYLSSGDEDKYIIAFFCYSGYRKLSDSTVDAISGLKMSPFENALDFDKSTDTKTLVKWLANAITKNALAYVKRTPKDRERAFEYHRPIAQLEDIISKITGQRIEFELQEDPLKIVIYVDDNPLEFDQLPDGLKSIISWIGDLIMRLDRINWETPESIMERNFILFLDEIEIHLHPAWQRKILPIIQHLFVNAQIFISTHSPFVVGSVDGAWIHRFVKKDNVTSDSVGKPILSEDSNSYEYVLNEIFEIRERFGVEVEESLQEFNKIKNKILSGDKDYDRTRFSVLIDILMKQSTEIQNIVGMELRQLNRITNQNFA